YISAYRSRALWRGCREIFLGWSPSFPCPRVWCANPDSRAPVRLRYAAQAGQPPPSAHSHRIRSASDTRCPRLSPVPGPPRRSLDRRVPTIPPHDAYTRRHTGASAWPQRDLFLVLTSGPFFGARPPLANELFTKLPPAHSH